MLNRFADFQSLPKSRFTLIFTEERFISTKYTAPLDRIKAKFFSQLDIPFKSDNVSQQILLDFFG